MKEDYFINGDELLSIYEVYGKNLVTLNQAIALYQKGLQLDPQNVFYHYRLGYAFHLARRLTEASSEYEKLLNLVPPERASDNDLRLAEKFTPRLYAHSNEFFALKDLVVVIHPQKPIIAYNLFWEDDIDYPGDNDPSDHEIIWIKFNPDKEIVTKVYTYFHRAILSTPEAVKDAHLHRQRAKVFTQWGEHGSLPLQWEKLTSENFYIKNHFTVKVKDMKERYLELRISTKNPEHPLARNWPKRFEGTYHDFINFSKYIDLRRFLKKKKMVIISKWPNAVINRYFLTYNYFPKRQWPEEFNNIST